MTKKNFYYLFGIVVGVLAVLRLLQAVDPAFETFGETLWYGVVTLTTVGYGDYAPASPQGRLIGGILVLSSLGILGFLVGQIGGIIANYRERRRLGLHGVDYEGHVVIVGWNELSKLIVEQLRGSPREAVVVTDDKPEVEAIDDQFDEDVVFSLYADYDDYERLDAVNFGDAFRVLMNLETDTELLIHTLNLRGEYPEAQFVVALDNHELEETFRSIGVEQAVSTHHIASKLTASIIFEPDVARYSTDLIGEGDDGPDYDFEQWRVGPECGFAGAPYRAVMEALYSDHGVMSVGISKPQESGSGRRLLKLPDDDVTVREGDYLVLIGWEAKEEELERVFGFPEGATEA